MRHRTPESIARSIARQKSRSLALHFVGGEEIVLFATSGGHLCEFWGHLNAIEREDGSGLKFNVMLTNCVGSKLVVFFDCMNPEHNIRSRKIHNHELAQLFNKGVID